MMLLQFGAGNIGRGFMGQLFREAGCEVVFVESDANLVRLLNERGSYPLRLLDAYRKETVEEIIEGIRAIPAQDREAVVSAFGEAHWVGTAVGINNYPAIAPLLAEGIRWRKEKAAFPCDIYLCENDLAAHTKMREALTPYLDDTLQAWMEENIGFVRVSVARMVPGKGKVAGDPLLLVADAYREFSYDEKARRAPLPSLSSMRAVHHFGAEFERKIYIYNLGHAVLAYLGYLRRYRYVHEGFDDEWISRVFDGALRETTEALFRKYPGVFHQEEHAHVLEDVRIRFGNPLLQDPIYRVARDPLRKLGPSDRLAGSALLCVQEGVFPENIATACAAALLYDFPEDAGAGALQEFIRVKGVEATLSEITSIEPQSPLGRRIIEEYYRLKALREE
jgi:mannitol-1-phosphate 5-dehydrogenase